MEENHGMDAQNCKINETKVLIWHRYFFIEKFTGSYLKLFISPLPYLSMYL
jgi:hypothetical protein